MKSDFEILYEKRKAFSERHTDLFRNLEYEKWLKNEFLQYYNSGLDEGIHSDQLHILCKLKRTEKDRDRVKKENEMLSLLFCKMRCCQNCKHFDISKNKKAHYCMKGVCMDKLHYCDKWEFKNE